MATSKAAVCILLAIGLIGGCESKRQHHTVRVDASSASIQWTEFEWYAKTDEGLLKYGTVRHGSGHPLWVAYAYDDLSQEHMFTTEAEAEKWLTTNWCHP